MSNYNNRNGVVKDHGHDEHKPMRYSKDSFVKELIGKVVRITLLNGKEVQGKLIELGMYDILIQTSQARLIVLKSGIMTVEVVA